MNLLLIIKFLQLRRSNNTQEFANVEILSTATGLDSENYVRHSKFTNYPTYVV